MNLHTSSLHAALAPDIGQDDLVEVPICQIGAGKGRERRAGWAINGNLNLWKGTGHVSVTGESAQCQCRGSMSILMTNVGGVEDFLQNNSHLVSFCCICTCDKTVGETARLAAPTQKKKKKNEG